MDTPNTVTSISRSFFCAAIVVSTLMLTGCAPSNLESCLADAAKAPTESGVALAANSCHQRFPAELKKEPKASLSASENKIRELCYVYWDGAGWKRGETEGDVFKRFAVGRYGVGLVEMAIPSKMVEELKVTGSNLFDNSNTEVTQWRDRYWYQIEALCDLN